jgi:transcriptional regulator with XRE-family HTH domain
MTVDHQAIQQADQALAIIEQFESLLEDLEAFVETLPKDHYQEGEVLLKKLQSLYQVINIDANHIDPLEEPIQKKRSKIERYRLASEVVRLAEEEGFYQKDIANRLGLSRSLVSKFLHQYENAKPSERAKWRRYSIFDTADQLEKLAATINRELARYQGEDGAIHVKYIDQMRQLIKESQQWMDKVSEQQKLEEIVRKVTEILSEECPSAEQQARIAQKFEQIGFGKTLPSS